MMASECIYYKSFSTFGVYDFQQLAASLHGRLVQLKQSGYPRTIALISVADMLRREIWHEITLRQNTEIVVFVAQQNNGKSAYNYENNRLYLLTLNDLTEQDTLTYQVRFGKLSERLVGTFPTILKNFSAEIPE